MIKLTDKLWIGDSDDALTAHLHGIKILFNVAQDLKGSMGWPITKYTQIGLIDGPGNLIRTYITVVVTLATLLEEGETLIYCHTGSRSLVIAIMYLHATNGGGVNWPGDWSPTWEGWLKLINKQVDITLPTLHEAHRMAFYQIKWRLITNLLES